jgi:periplasmic protein TonB
MYKYEEPSLFSGKRGVAFIVVIIIHVIVGFGFYTGLASKFVQHIVAPVEVSQIDKPKQDDKPPPPPPKLEEIKPYVPPPEFVDIQSAPPPETAITQTVQQNTPPPQVVQQAPAPVQHAVTPARMDPKHPFKIGEEYYPDASKRANEEGRCVVMAQVAANGNIGDAKIAQSSGFPRLDEACLKGVKGQRALPGMEDGKPVEGTFQFAIVWKLTGK